MPRGEGTYGSKRGRPSLSGKTKAQAAAKKRIAKKKVEAKKTAVKKAVKAGLKDLGHAALGTSGLRAGARLTKKLKARKKK